MENLVFLKDKEALTDSVLVSQMFGKRHNNVMRTIDGLIESLLKNEQRQEQKMFIPSRRKLEDGQFHRVYLMNRDGFSLLVMGFTGQKAFEWKVKYIEAFNKMETVIREKSTTAWLETRQFGQITRKAECETLKKLVDYAKSQGSQHADMLYMTYSKLANTMSGIKNRDEATVKQLTTLSLVENIILHVIDMGIIGQKHYKEIYQDCKGQIESFKAVAFIEDERNGHQHS